MPRQAPASRPGGGVGYILAGMVSAFTARYVKIPAGYMGQIVEWPEVVTEGKDLEACRESLRDAVREMVLAHREMGKEHPFDYAPAGPTLH